MVIGQPGLENSKLKVIPCICAGSGVYCLMTYIYQLTAIASICAGSGVYCLMTYVYHKTSSSIYIYVCGRNGAMKLGSEGASVCELLMSFL